MGLTRRAFAGGVAAAGVAAACRASPPGPLLIRGGRVWTDGREQELDLRVRDGRIAELGPGLAPRQDQVVDAQGLLVLPGGIDPHVHLGDPGRADDFVTGSQAALAGGITTVGNMTFPDRGETTLRALRRQAALARRTAIADVLLHPVVFVPTDDVLAELPAVADAGYRSVKVFLSIPVYAANRDRFRALARRARDLGLVLLVHCEDHGVTRAATAALVASGRAGLEHFADASPVASEVAAVTEAISICRDTGVTTYLVHVSSAEALALCRAAKADGLPLSVETRPIYLFFTRERFATPDGPLYVGQPPLRTEKDRLALWGGLADGTIDVVASDHSPFTRREKLDPAQTIESYLAGVPNLQTMLPLLMTEGVLAGRIDLARFVALTAGAPARNFQLSPRKGALAVGADADLALWNLRDRVPVRAAAMFSAAGYDLWEERPLVWPTLTMRRGEIVFADGAIAARPGSGRVQVLRRAAM